MRSAGCPRADGSDLALRWLGPSRRGNRVDDRGVEHPDRACPRGWSASRSCRADRRQSSAARRRARPPRPPCSACCWSARSRAAPCSRRCAHAQAAPIHLRDLFDQEGVNLCAPATIESVDQTPSAAPDHPLAPLTADEIRGVRRIVDAHGLSGQSVRSCTSRWTSRTRRRRGPSCRRPIERRPGPQSLFAVQQIV